MGDLSPTDPSGSDSSPEGRHFTQSLLCSRLTSPLPPVAPRSQCWVFHHPSCPPWTVFSYSVPRGRTHASRCRWTKRAERKQILTTSLPLNFLNPELPLVHSKKCEFHERVPRIRRATHTADVRPLSSQATQTLTPRTPASVKTKPAACT